VEQIPFFVLVPIFNPRITRKFLNVVYVYNPTATQIHASLLMYLPLNVLLLTTYKGHRGNS